MESFRYRQGQSPECVCYMQCGGNESLRLADLVVGPYPDFSPSHDYTVTLDLGTGTPTSYEFGMADCGCYDNSGTHTLTLTPIAGASCVN
jgi:hypothetical protein